MRTSSKSCAFYVDFISSYCYLGLVFLGLLLAVVVVVVMVREVTVILKAKLNLTAVDLILDLILVLIVISVVVAYFLSHPAVYEGWLLLYPDLEVVILVSVLPAAEQTYFDFRAGPQSQTLLIQIRMGKCK